MDVITAKENEENEEISLQIQCTDKYDVLTIESRQSRTCEERVTVWQLGYNNLKALKGDKTMWAYILCSNILIFEYYELSRALIPSTLKCY